MLLIYQKVKKMRDWIKVLDYEKIKLIFIKTIYSDGTYKIKAKIRIILTLSQKEEIVYFRRKLTR